MFKANIRPHRPTAPTWLFVLSILIAGVLVIPLIYLVVRTVGAGQEVWDLLFRWRTAEILLRSVTLVISVTFLSIILAVPLAWLTVRTNIPLRRLWGIVTILPLIMPSYVAGFLFVLALGPKGLLHQFINIFWTLDSIPSIYGFPGAVLTLTFLSYPYILITTRAGLLRIDSSLEESSRTLGHGDWSTFKNVTLPLLRPALAAGSLLVALYTLSDFGAVSLLRYETFTWAIYQQYESGFGRIAASSLSILLLIIAFGILLAESQSRGNSDTYSNSGNTSRQITLIPLGKKWAALSLIFCSSIVLISLVIPIAILCYWMLRGLSSGEVIPSLWMATFNSLLVSSIAAVVAIIVSLPIAILAIRYPGKLATFIEKISFVGFALPGIVVSLALVFFLTNVATPLYQTLSILIIAYVILFMPASLGPLKTSLLQISPRLEEAARSLGKSPFQTLCTITIPLMLPGIYAGGALVFLLTMKELPATLILGPIGFQTLSTSIWSAASEAFFAKAAAPALLLIMVTSIMVSLLILNNRRLYK